MRFSLLGPLVVRRGDRALPVGGPKSRALLAALLFQPNRAVSLSSLRGALWGEEPPATAVASLHNHVTRLRRVLDTEGTPRVVSTPQGVQLRVAEGELDLQEFTELLARSREALTRLDWQDVSRLTGAALALWRGEPLSDIAHLHTLEAETRHLGQAHLQALEWHFEAELHLGRHTEVTPELSRWAACHPLHEALHVQLITALYRGGRQAEALAVFETIRTMLAEELGVDPGASLRAVHQQVLTADPALVGRPAGARVSVPPAAGGISQDPTARTEPPTGGGVGATGPTGTEAAQTLPTETGQRDQREPTALVPAQLPADTPLFTGRQEELQHIVRVLEQASSGDGPHVVTVTGMGGVGKSALAVHAAHLLRVRFPDGQLHLDLRGFGALSPRPVHEVLATLLTDLRPEAASTNHQPLPEDTDQRAALLRTVLAERRVLIVLDNARDSAQVLPLLPGAGPCAVIVTSRGTLTDLPTHDHVPLAPMDVEDQRALLSAVCGSDRVERDLDGALRVLAACAGLPLALRIAGARLAARPTWPLTTLADRLGDGGHGRLTTLSAGQLGVRATFDSSYLALRDSDQHAEREMARAFRLLGLWPGQVLTPASAAALLDRTPQEAEDLLEHLVDTHLLQSPVPLGYRLHDLLAEYAAERAHTDESAQSRDAALLRLCVWYALALERARIALGAGGQLPPRLDQVPSAPLPVFADGAQALAWCREELANLGEAIRQAGEGPRPDLAWRLAVWLLGYMRTSWWTGQWEDYLNQALRTAERSGDRLGRAWVLRSLGACHGMSRRLDAAITLLEEALELFDDPASQATIMSNLSLAYNHGGRPDRALDYARAALDIHRQVGGNRQQTAILLSSMADALRVAGHDEEAERHYQEALGLWREHGDADSIAISLANHGDVLRGLGRREEAFAALHEALDISHLIGNTASIADTLVITARAHAHFAEWPQARARIHEAIDLANRHHLDAWLSEARDVLDMIETAYPSTP